MIIPEYLAKYRLKRLGLATPRGRVAHSRAEAAAIAGEIGAPVAIKIQVDSGKRGKAGGIQFAASPEQAGALADAMLGSTFLDFTVREVLVEEKLSISRELYAGMIVDRSDGSIRLIVGLAGGMEVEEARAETVKTLRFEPGGVLPAHRVARWLAANGVEDNLVEPLAFVVGGLYRALIDLDLIQIEVNPLAVLADGRLVALDCKMEVDDNALARQTEFAELFRQSLGAREKKAAELGVSFVPLDGDVGVIASGAGLGMATLDILRGTGLVPADFLDTGGGITTDLMREAVKIVMADESTRGLMVNLYGGINPMIAAAEGIVQGLESLPTRKPVVVKLLGNSQEEAWKILESFGVTVIKVAQTEVAVDTLAKLLGGNDVNPA